MTGVAASEDEVYSSVVTRLHSSFPSGRAGVGLLLLRVACGLVVCQQGIGLTFASTPRGGLWWLGFVEITSSCCLIAGVLVPFVTVITGAALAGAWFALTGRPEGEPLATVVLVFGMTAAVALLGPGAYSLDARRFGRREVIIPRARPPRLGP